MQVPKILVEPTSQGEVHMPDIQLTDRQLRLRIKEPRVAWQRVVDDMVLLDLEQSVYHGLNRTGALVWEGLAAHNTVGELVDRVAIAYPDSAEVAALDVSAFLEALFSAGLIEVQTDGEKLHDDST